MSKVFNLFKALIFVGLIIITWISSIFISYILAILFGVGILIFIIYSIFNVKDELDIEPDNIRKWKEEYQ